MQIQSSKPGEIQCRECEGLGHIQAECVNTLKKNKSDTVSWSDDETVDGRVTAEDNEDIIALVNHFEWDFIEFVQNTVALILIENVGPSKV